MSSISTIRISVLILAHKNPEQLQRLINHLCADFDIYVHIDQKSNIPAKIKNAHVISNHSISWGSKEQILATLDLFTLAQEKQYDRYLFISGQDIPLISNQEIINFFTNNPNNYIDYRSLPASDGWGGGTRAKRMSLFWLDESRNVDSVKRAFKKKLQKTLHSLQKGLRLYRKLPENLYGGANWMDLNQAAMNEIINFIRNNPKYLARYNYTRCADEIFFHSILLNTSESKNCVNQSLRYVDFKNGPEFPRTLRSADLTALKHSSAVFARKFDSTVDAKIIDSIYTKITNIEHSGPPHDE